MAANTVISEERESGCSVLTAFTVFFFNQASERTGVTENKL